MAEPRPTHYKIVCCSIYTRDLDELDRKVEFLKRSGWLRANRSHLIRIALSRLTDAELEVIARDQRRSGASSGDRGRSVGGQAVLAGENVFDRGAGPRDEKGRFVGDQTHVVCWRGAFTGATGRSEPMTESAAREVVAWGEANWPRLIHWAEAVAGRI